MTMFATKDELLAMRQSIDAIQTLVSSLPTRNEWQLRSEFDDAFRAETKRAQEENKDALEALPGKFLRTVGVMVGTIVSIATLANFLLQHWKP